MSDEPAEPAETRPVAHCTRHTAHDPYCTWCYSAEVQMAQATRTYVPRP